MHSKFHWLIHFPRHLEQFLQLPSCFVQERKHKVVKRYSSSISNTITLEKSVMAEILSHDLAKLKLPGTFATRLRLSKSCQPAKKLKDLLETSSGCVCHKGDICILQDNSIKAGQIWVHADINGKLMSLISEWALVEYNPKTYSATFSKANSAIWVESSTIQSSVAWTFLKQEGVYRILVPFMMRK